jgi:hypothetical protein
MAPSPIWTSLVTGVALAATIMLLGSMFLFILRAPKIQFSLRFLLLAIGGVAVTLGAWSAVLRTASGPIEAGPARERTRPAGNYPTQDVPGQLPIPLPDAPGRMMEYNEYLDGLPRQIELKAPASGQPRTPQP